MRDSAEKVKKALEEAERAQIAASNAIQQAATDIQTSSTLLSSVSFALLWKFEMPTLIF